MSPAQYYKDILSEVELVGRDELEKLVAMMEQKTESLGREKAKLSELKQSLEKGKTLSPTQLENLVAFDAQMDILTEITDNVKSTLTKLRKTSKERELEMKSKQAEVERGRLIEILKMNRVFVFLGEESIRKKITRKPGVGNVELTREQLDNLDKFFKLVNPDANASDDAGINKAWSEAARKLQLYMNNSRKSVLLPNITFYDIRNLIKSIYECPSLNQPTPVDEPKPVERKKKSNRVTKTKDAKPATPEEFVVIAKEDVPSADSQEIRDSLPPVITPTTEITFTNNVDEVALTRTPPIEPLPNPQTFEKIMQKTQGSFNFIQDSQIDPIPVSSDPAVVAVQHMPNNGPAQPSHSVDPYAQFAPPQSVSIPTTVIENSMYSQQATQQYPQTYQSPQVFLDPPQPIPLPAETPGFQETFHSDPSSNQQPANADLPDADPAKNRLSPSLSADADSQAPRSQEAGSNRRGRGGQRGRGGPTHNGYYGRGNTRGGRSDQYNGRDFHERENFDDRDRFNARGERQGGRGVPRADRGDRGGHRWQSGPSLRGSSKTGRGGTWSNSGRGNAPPAHIPPSQP